MLVDSAGQYKCVESTHNDMPNYSKNNCNETALIADILYEGIADEPSKTYPTAK
jgi:hypothetical protein